MQSQKTIKANGKELFDNLDNINKVRELLEKEADANYVVPNGWWKDWTPLAYAIKKNKVDLIKLLLDNRAIADQKYPGEEFFVSSECQRKEVSLLDYVIIKHYWEAAFILVDKGASIPSKFKKLCSGIVEEQCYSPLKSLIGWKSYFKKDEHITKLVEIMLSRGEGHDKTFSHESALACAVDNDILDIIQLLVKFKVNVDSPLRRYKRYAPNVGEVSSFKLPNNGFIDTSTELTCLEYCFSKVIYLACLKTDPDAAQLYYISDTFEQGNFFTNLLNSIGIRPIEKIAAKHSERLVRTGNIADHTKILQEMYKISRYYQSTFLGKMDLARILKSSPKQLIKDREELIRMRLKAQKAEKESKSSLPTNHSLSLNELKIDPNNIEMKNDKSMYLENVYDDLPPLIDEPDFTTPFNIPAAPKEKLEYVHSTEMKTIDSQLDSKEELDEQEDIPTEFKAWDEVSKDKILLLLADEKITPDAFETLKFFLGPAFNPILSQYRHELYEELDSSYFIYSCIELLVERMQQGIQIYIEFIHAQQIITIREKQIEGRPINAEIKMQALKNSFEAISKKVKEQGLEVFNEWHTKYKRTLDELCEGVIIGASPLLFFSEEVPLSNSVRDELRTILDTWVSPWLEKEVAATWCIKGEPKEYIVSKLKMLELRLIECFMDSNNISELKNRLFSYDFPLRNYYKNKKTEYSKQIKDVANNYIKFANVFLKSENNRFLVKRFLFPLDSSRYKGLNSNELIHLIIRYKLHVPHYKNTNFIKKIIPLISKAKDDMKSKIEHEFENHCPILLLEKAKASYHAVQDTYKRICEEHCWSITYNELLSSSIKDPLSQPELLLLLDAFICSSQKQLTAKNYLKELLQYEETLFSWYRCLFYRPITIDVRRDVQFAAAGILIAASTGNDELIWIRVPEKNEKKEYWRKKTNLPINYKFKLMSNDFRLNKLLHKFENESSNQEKSNQKESNKLKDKEVSAIKKKTTCSLSPLLSFSLIRFPTHPSEHGDSKLNQIKRFN